MQCKTNQKYLRNKTPNESVNVKIWVGPCSGVYQKSEIAKKEKKKAEAESKTPHQMCAVTATKAYQIEEEEKENILQENLLWCQNSCEIAG